MELLHFPFLENVHLTFDHGWIGSFVKTRQIGGVRVGRYSWREILEGNMS